MSLRPLYTCGRYSANTREGIILYTPAQYTAMFTDSGEEKTRRPAWQILALALLARDLSFTATVPLEQVPGRPMPNRICGGHLELHNSEHARA